MTKQNWRWQLLGDASSKGFFILSNQLFSYFDSLETTEWFPSKLLALSDTDLILKGKFDLQVTFLSQTTLIQLFSRWFGHLTVFSNWQSSRKCFYFSTSKAFIFAKIWITKLVAKVRIVYHRQVIQVCVDVLKYMLFSVNQSDMKEVKEMFNKLFIGSR